MSDVIDYKIHGNDMQIVEVELDPGEGVRGEGVGPLAPVLANTSDGGQATASGFKRSASP
ncbi:hypothetical protein BMS3Abin14_01029 [bacterium BMS3Abin14]|nr:hypothetical protein BMS3Abin14_01029 [bacterium BMS3Abin14]